MTRSLNRVVIALSCAGLLALPSVVSAQAAAKKLTYEQAWAQCKQEISKTVGSSETGNTAGRHAAGGACMHKYGYRLKK